MGNTVNYSFIEWLSAYIYVKVPLSENETFQLDHFILTKRRQSKQNNDSLKKGFTSPPLVSKEVAKQREKWHAHIEQCKPLKQ